MADDCMGASFIMKNVLARIGNIFIECFEFDVG